MNVRVSSSHHSLTWPPERNHTTSALEAIPRSAEYIPPITTIRPYVGTLRPPQSAAKVEATALGSPTSPEASAVCPSPSCIYISTSTQMLVIPMKYNVMSNAPLAKLGVRKIARSTMGERPRRCCRCAHHSHSPPRQIPAGVVDTPP